jgi:hypothetical protein
MIGNEQIINSIFPCWTGIFHFYNEHPENEVIQMNTKKIITAFALFSAMFSSAWYANEKTKRTYINPDAYDQSRDESRETEDPFYLSYEEIRMLEKFKPREYIRIVNK